MTKIRIRELFDCSVKVPLSLHLSMSSLCWLCLSVCLLLPVPVTFLSFSQCLFLPPLVSFTVPLEPISLPSLLSPPPLYLLPSLNAVISSSSEPGSPLPNPRWINIHYTFHSDSVIKDCIQLVSPRAETSMHISPRSGQT